MTEISGVPAYNPYIDRGINLQPYSKLYIDPVQVFLNTDKAYSGVQPDVMKRIKLADYHLPKQEKGKHYYADP